MIQWTHAGPYIVTSFLAALVEFVEALTIVLAVGTVRGWRPAIAGTVAGVLSLALLVLFFGPALQQVPLTTLQFVIGVLLLLFGMRWLRKAILRSAGVIGFHDEATIFARETNALRVHTGARRFDMVAAITSFKAVVLEGLEVVFIVIAVGAVNHMLIPASLGAAAAGVLVVMSGIMLHKPLARVPENTLKFAVGVLLSSFGTFWIGEGLRFEWPGDDLSLLGLGAGFLLISGLGVSVARQASVSTQ